MAHELTISDDTGEMMRVSYSNGRSTFSPTSGLKMKCGYNKNNEYEVRMQRNGVDGFIVEQEVLTIAVIK